MHTSRSDIKIVYIDKILYVCKPSKSKMIFPPSNNDMEFTKNNEANEKDYDDKSSNDNKDFINKPTTKLNVVNKDMNNEPFNIFSFQSNENEHDDGNNKDMSTKDPPRLSFDNFQQTPQLNPIETDYDLFPTEQEDDNQPNPVPHHFVSFHRNANGNKRMPDEEAGNIVKWWNKFPKLNPLNQESSVDNKNTPNPSYLPRQVSKDKNSFGFLDQTNIDPETYDLNHAEYDLTFEEQENSPENVGPWQQKFPNLSPYSKHQGDKKNIANMKHPMSHKSNRPLKPRFYDPYFVENKFKHKNQRPMQQKKFNIGTPTSLSSELKSLKLPSRKSIYYPKYNQREMFLTDDTVNNDECDNDGTNYNPDKVITPKNDITHVEEVESYDIDDKIDICDDTDNTDDNKDYAKVENNIDGGLETIYNNEYNDDSKTDDIYTVYTNNLMDNHNYDIGHTNIFEISDQQNKELDGSDKFIHKFKKRPIARKEYKNKKEIGINLKDHLGNGKINDYTESKDEDCENNDNPSFDYFDESGLRNPLNEDEILSGKNYDYIGKDIFDPVDTINTNIMND